MAGCRNQSLGRSVTGMRAVSGPRRRTRKALVPRSGAGAPESATRHSPGAAGAISAVQSGAGGTDFESGPNGRTGSGNPAGGFVAGRSRGKILCGSFVHPSLFLFQIRREDSHRLEVGFRGGRRRIGRFLRVGGEHPHRLERLGCGRRPKRIIRDVHKRLDDL